VKALVSSKPVDCYLCRHNKENGVLLLDVKGDPYSVQHHLSFNLEICSDCLAKLIEAIVNKHSGPIPLRKK
jgi:hypothetical protein